jgi:DNA-binding CsgD family transcriptional regulator/tetratricopeptide (TPR) repeat protein
MAQAIARTAKRNGLLERSAQLEELAGQLEAVTVSSRGRLVLIGGEAGVGKTALVRRFEDELPRSTRVLSGTCDGLFTPRPLGPFLDIAESTEGELQRQASDGVRPHEFAAGLIRELRANGPAVVVLEDLHWADAATLDVLRLLGRRVDSVPALVVVTYRDDELPRTHPLRMLLGDFAGNDDISRIRIMPLSQAAVAELAAPYGLDGVELYRKTGGNAFFVTEVLASGDSAIPRTVQDAVLARVARLSPAAQSLVEAVAIIPTTAELWLLEALCPAAMSTLDECLASGVLSAVPSGVAFRHQLARLAVEESLDPVRRMDLNRRALAALANPPTGKPDVTRLAHHAEAANDAAATLEYATAAGRMAAARGAHREAAAQYDRALRFAEGHDTILVADLQESYAYERYLCDHFDDAVRWQRAAVESYRRADSAAKLGGAQRQLTHFLRCGGWHDEAEIAGREALAVLEKLPLGPELAKAHATQAFICMCKGDKAGTFDWGGRAIELAEQTGSTWALVHALNTVGTMEMEHGRDGGLQKLSRSLELALREGFEEEVGRAYLNLVGMASLTRSFDGFDSLADAGIEYCSERGLDSWRRYLYGSLARVEVDRGNWEIAVDWAQSVLAESPSRLTRFDPLIAIALVRARRGDPDSRSPLDEVAAIAVPTGELQLLAQVAATQAEAAWLAGRPEEIANLTEAAFRLAQSEGSPWYAGELAAWRMRAGIVEAPPEHAAEPYRLELAGDFARAAQAWLDLGCGYNAAVVLCCAGEADGLRWALAEFQRLGARPAAAIAAQRLRELGERDLPRGPRESTRSNPSQLTPRELEVLELVAQGFSDAEIAKRLFLSKRTVHHHVSAILRKLGVNTRAQAAAQFRQSQVAI